MHIAGLPTGRVIIRRPLPQRSVLDRRYRGQKIRLSTTITRVVPATAQAPALGGVGARDLLGLTIAMPATTRIVPRRFAESVLIASATRIARAKSISYLHAFSRFAPARALCWSMPCRGWLRADGARRVRATPEHLPARVRTRPRSKPGAYRRTFESNRCCWCSSLWNAQIRSTLADPALCARWRATTRCAAGS